MVVMMRRDMLFFIVAVIAAAATMANVNAWVSLPKNTRSTRNVITKHHHDSFLLSLNGDDNDVGGNKEDHKETRMTNHIFHEYDKPLVLLGCSGAGDELQRLAEAFVRQSQRRQPSSQQQQGMMMTAAQQVLLEQSGGGGGVGGTLSEPPLSSASSSSSNNESNSRAGVAVVTAGGGIIKLVGMDATQGWFVMPLEELKRAITSQKKYQWPDVLVLDLADLDAVAAVGGGGGDNNPLQNNNNMDALEMYFRQVMQLLYEELDMLSIYINVDAVASNMNMATRKRQQRMESFFVQYSDYELCIQQEGLDPATIVAQELLLLQQQKQQQQQQQQDDGLSIPTTLSNGDSDEVSSTLLSMSLEDNKELLQEAIEEQEEGWNHIEWELRRLIARARLTSPIPGDGGSTYSTTTTTSTAPIIRRPDNCARLTMGPHTFFLSLSVPEIDQVEPFIADMCLDVDAMEYRADLLQCRNSRFDLLYGMQQLRCYCRPHVVRVPALPCPIGSNNGGVVLEDVMPIVYTVRTCHQAGTYPDDLDVGIPNMFTLLTWGLRGGVEVLDVESAWDTYRTNQLIQLVQRRYASQILGSHHVVGKTVSLEEAVVLFQQCALQGRAHGAKLVLSIDSEQMDQMAYQAALIATSLAESEDEPIVIPHISLILGEMGQYSRIINFPFTPVTHESLPTPAAPGQLTASEIMTTRLLAKLLLPKRYAILGHNIAYSVSPQMHNAAFAATRLPHQYYRADVATVEEFCSSDFFKSSDFGGASVTIPHKQSIIPFVNVMSEAAQAIGSVNTLIVKEELLVDNDDEEGEGNDEESDNNASDNADGGDGGGYKRIIYGDNTDWRGIYNPLNRMLLRKNINSETDVCLIVGAGGTARAAAYAAQKLGLQRIYYNRTPEKAQELADSFGGIVVSSLEEQQQQGHEDHSLGQALWKLGGNGIEANVRVVISTLPAAANFELPNWLYRTTTVKPIVFDVNYKPYYTQLLLQAESKGCAVVRGSEMLWEQGVGQFELWTERTAPYSVMKQVVLDNCLPKEEEEGADDGVDGDSNRALEPEANGTTPTVSSSSSSTTTQT